MSNPSDPALRVEGLVKRYGDLHAIDHASFTVAPGEFVVLLGPSGSGKSTIFRCISRLARPDAGSIHIGATRLDRLEGRALRAQRRSIGLVFQQFNLIGRLSAIDNVLAGRLGSAGAWRATFRAFTRSDRQLALAALDRVGLLGKAYQRADSLSGGQQQRVAIARVVAQQSRIILADEPVASLDPSSAETVLELLQSIAREHGIAVLCSLHQTDLARRYADRIIAMRAGRIVIDAKARDLDAAVVDAIYRSPSPTTASVPALAPVSEPAPAVLARS